MEYCPGEEEYCPDCQSVGTHTKGGGSPGECEWSIHEGLLNRISNAFPGVLGGEGGVLCTLLEPGKV
jgi:hypothetical protein